MGEIVADSIHAAAAHCVKVAVGREIDANGADSGGWHVRTRVPAVRRTTKTDEARWILLFRPDVRLPVCQCKWNHTNSQKRKQDKGASKNVRSSAWMELTFHEGSFANGAPMLDRSGREFRDFFVF